MAATVRFTDAVVGTRLRTRTADRGRHSGTLVVTVPRLTVMMFCGASGDFAGPHWNERIARSVGLPDVMAHRGLTITAALRLVHEWVGDPAAVIEYRARFVKPVLVPDDDTGAVLCVTGAVQALYENKRVGVDLVVADADDDVLATVHATVQLA
jgi:acyl dehydratase